MVTPTPIQPRHIISGQTHLPPGVAPAQTQAAQNQSTEGTGGYYTFTPIIGSDGEILRIDPTAPAESGPSAIPPFSPSIVGPTPTTSPAQPSLNGIVSSNGFQAFTSPTSVTPPTQQPSFFSKTMPDYTGIGINGAPPGSFADAVFTATSYSDGPPRNVSNSDFEPMPAPTDLKNITDAGGRRVRLRPRPAATDVIYGNSPILNPLTKTHGMIWPYQPVITYSQDVDYKSMELVHSNQDIYSYHRTPSLKLAVDGEFTVQNQQEGLYAMACIHYLRVITKMYFGDSNGQADSRKGTPPPILLFDAYGAYMFNSLPVIVTNFTVSLPKDVDYVPIDMTSTLAKNTSGSFDNTYLTNPYLNMFQNVGNTTGSSGLTNVAWLPAVFNIQVQLVVQNIPSRLRKFSLDGFRNGTLLKQGGWV